MIRQGKMYSFWNEKIKYRVKSVYQCMNMLSIKLNNSS